MQLELGLLLPVHSKCMFEHTHVGIIPETHHTIAIQKCINQVDHAASSFWFLSDMHVSGMVRTGLTTTLHAFLVMMSHLGPYQLKNL